MNKHKGKQELDFNNSTQAIEGILNNITSHKLIGMDLVLGKIFDEIGFSQIEDKLFKDLIPIGLSKKQAENGPISFSLWRKEIHRRCHLWLYGQASQYAKGIGWTNSYTHSKQVLGDDPQVVFYDVTTIYFEVDNEDELRKTGFSKEDKGKK